MASSLDIEAMLAEAAAVVAVEVARTQELPETDVQQVLEAYASSHPDIHSTWVAEADCRLVLGSRERAAAVNPTPTLVAVHKSELSASQVYQVTFQATCARYAGASTRKPAPAPAPSGRSLFDMDIERPTGAKPRGSFSMALAKKQASSKAAAPRRKRKADFGSLATKPKSKPAEKRERAPAPVQELSDIEWSEESSAVESGEEDEEEVRIMQISCKRKPKKPQQRGYDFSSMHQKGQAATETVTETFKDEHGFIQVRTVEKVVSRPEPVARESTTAKQAKPKKKRVAQVQRAAPKPAGKKKKGPGQKSITSFFGKK